MKTKFLIFSIGILFISFNALSQTIYSDLMGRKPISLENIRRNVKGIGEAELATFNKMIEGRKVSWMAIYKRGSISENFFGDKYEVEFVLGLNGKKTYSIDVESHWAGYIEEAKRLGNYVVIQFSAEIEEIIKEDGIAYPVLDDIVLVQMYATARSRIPTNYK